MRIHEMGSREEGEGVKILEKSLSRDGGWGTQMTTTIYCEECSMSTLVRWYQSLHFWFFFRGTVPRKHTNNHSTTVTIAQEVSTITAMNATRPTLCLWYIWSYPFWRDSLSEVTLWFKECVQTSLHRIQWFWDPLNRNVMLLDVNLSFRLLGADWLVVVAQLWDQSGPAKTTISAPELAWFARSQKVESPSCWRN